MKIWKRVTQLICAMLVVLSVATPALAAQVGSITVTLHEDSETPIRGGTLTLYHVAVPKKNGADEYYSFTPAFGIFEDEILATLDSGSLPKTLASHAKNTDVKPAGTQKTGKDGTVTFANLELGLYLVVQTGNAPGYLPIDPFLVTIPYRTPDGKLLYDVDATPKSEPGEPIPEPPETTEPTTPPGGGKPPLIQTGQLNWPVPVLAIVGMLLFAAGWVLVSTGKDRHDP